MIAFSFEQYEQSKLEILKRNWYIDIVIFPLKSNRLLYAKAVGNVFCIYLYDK